MKKKILIGIISAIVFCCSLTAGILTVTAENSPTNLDEIVTDQIWGTEYVLPKANIQTDSGIKMAETLLYTPSGKVISTAETTLNEAGEYTLVFIVRDNGQQTVLKKTFCVQYPVMDFGGGAGDAIYLTNEEYAGLKVNATSGKEATLNRYIDISQATSSDVLFKLRVTPKVEGVAEITRMEVKLTDVYDESNYITIRFNSDTASGNTGFATYVSAAANGRLFSGYNYDGGTPSLKVNSVYGTTIYSTFEGRENEFAHNKFASPYFELRYDYAEKCLYVPNYGGSSLLKVIDFDNRNDFDDIWQGFTDGKVRVSVKCIGADANYVITDIFDADLTEKSFIDDVKPNILLETPETLPVSSVNAEYTIFPSTAFDLYSGSVPVESKVFFCYNDDEMISIPVVNGKFQTQYQGNYKIIYSAKDFFGNYAETILDIQTLAQTSNIQVTTMDEYGKGLQGIKINYIPATAEGGSGENIVTQDVFYQDGSQDFYIDEMGFIPNKVGNYRVVYTAKDYIGKQQTLEKVVVVEQNIEPVFQSEITLQKFMIEGNSYILPDLYAIDYVTGETIKATITVSDANGEKILTDNMCVPNCKNTGDLIAVKYEVKGKKGSAKKTFEIPVYKVKYVEGDEEYIDFSKYFIKDPSVVSEYTLKGINLTADIGKIEYINPVIAKELSLVFDISVGSRVRLYLHDSANYTDEFFVEFNTMSDRVVVNVNGEITADTNYFTNRENEIKFVLNTNEGFIKVGTKTFTPKSMPKIDSGFAYIGWDILQNNTKLSVIKINTLDCNEKSKDRSKPQIYYTRGKVNCSLGDIAQTAPVFCADLLDSYTTCTLTVTNPKGNIVTDINGVKLENLGANVAYEFRCDQYGIYTVTYSAKDSYGNRVSTNYLIRVWDSTPPTISKVNIPSSVTCGTTLEIPKANVSDAETSKAEGYVCVKSPKGVIEHIAGEKYTFNQIGVYQVIYYAKDSNGNLQITSYKILVK